MDANWLSTGNSHPASSLRGLLWNGPSARSIGLSIQYEPLVESYHARLSLSLPSEGLSSAAIREESRPNPGRPAPMCRLLLRSAIPCCPEVACFDQCHHFGVVLWQVTCLVKVHVKMRYNCKFCCPVLLDLRFGRRGPVPLFPLHRVRLRRRLVPRCPFFSPIFGLSVSACLLALEYSHTQTRSALAIWTPLFVASLACPSACLSGR